MLAKISEGIPDAIRQLKGAPFLAEYKYDGTRAQVHLLSDNSVKVFSRNCEDKTVSMPDVVAAIQAAAKGRYFLLLCGQAIACLESWVLTIMGVVLGAHSHCLSGFAASFAGLSSLCITIEYKKQ